jgi:hypothetical protein
MKTKTLLLFAGRREDFPARKARIAAAAEALDNLMGVWYKIEMVVAGMKTEQAVQNLLGETGVMKMSRKIGLSFLWWLPVEAGSSASTLCETSKAHYAPICKSVLMGWPGVKGVSYVRLTKNLTVIFLLLVLASRVSRADVTKLCVVPVDIKGGRGEEIRIFARDSMRGLFEKYGFQWIVLSSAGLGFTRETDMLKMGKESGCDLVLSATMEIKSKHGWHITGPRAKAEATMSSNIVDVKGEKVIFNVMNQTADSKRKNLDQAAVAVFVSLGGAFLMGGSRAAQEKRAIANILTDVYEPFLTTQGRSIQSESRGTGVSPGQGPWVDFPDARGGF